ncbi:MULTISPECIES: hypothetical protein [Candidatus Ichthyocystis]|uniref:hypothetical protein n=1 Tax=Candidatus Ichthyocystis TaxID=2929841 RepID=UPI000B860FB9|nr:MULTISPECIES: hypothetical protein [Ichthyocystis]
MNPIPLRRGGVGGSDVSGTDNQVNGFKAAPLSFGEDSVVAMDSNSCPRFLGDDAQSGSDYYIHGDRAEGKFNRVDPTLTSGHGDNKSIVVDSDILKTSGIINVASGDNVVLDGETITFKPDVSKNCVSSSYVNEYDSDLDAYLLAETGNVVISPEERDVLEAIMIWNNNMPDE